MNEPIEARPWMQSALLCATAYNVVAGAAMTAFPATWLSLIGVDATPSISTLTQSAGLAVVVIGFGFYLAARQPYDQWTVVLLGLLLKLSSAIGLTIGIANGSLPFFVIWFVAAHSLVWLVPLTLILWGAARYSQIIKYAYELSEDDDPRRELTTSTGKSLDELASESPQLVVFLRHAGCTFCRQSLADLSAQREQIEQTGCGIVLVHLGVDDPDADAFFRQYGVDDLPRISDPSCRLYRQFGLDLGGFSQLFGLKVWLRGLVAGLYGGHGIGAVQGNSFQMPGVYLYHCGVILDGYRHETASDRPDYLALARQVEMAETAIAG
jgi:peroxiredoxin